jgi:hypothetical protein
MSSGEIPTDIGTDDANPQTVALDEPAPDLFIAKNRVSFTVQTGDLNESDFAVLDSREPDSTRPVPTRGHTVGEFKKLYLPVDNPAVPNFRYETK